MKKGPPACLDFIGEKELPSYVGIATHHEIRMPSRQPVIIMESKRVFFVAHLFLASMDSIVVRFGFTSPLSNSDPLGESHFFEGIPINLHLPLLLGGGSI